MANIASNSISMFPSSMRTGVDVYSRFTTELNLVDIVNRVSSGNFVSKFDTESANGDIEFTIGGYNFRTTYTAIASALGVVNYSQNIYAIAITEYGSNEVVNDTILKGFSSNSLQTSVDADGKFIGLQIIQTNNIDTEVSNIRTTLNNNRATIYSLELLHSNETSSSMSNWSVPDNQQVLNVGIITESDVNGLFPEIHAS